MNLEASALQGVVASRSRRTRRRLPRRARLEAGLYGWYARTNYGIVVSGSTQAMAARRLEAARYIVNDTLAGGILEGHF